MFLDVCENKDQNLNCECYKCTSKADVLLELVADSTMPLCKRHCYNTLKNLGMKESDIAILKD